MTQLLFNILTLIMITCLLTASALQWRITKAQIEINKALRQGLLDTLKICKEIAALHHNEPK